MIQEYNEVLKNQFVFNYDIVPTRPSDAQYKYVFREWSPELHRIKEDTTYIATYDKIPLYVNIEDSMVPSEDHGKLFIFGEAHGDKGILEEELKVWGNYYENYGFRDLFVEQDQVWATLFNIYMQTDGDDYSKHIFRWYEDGAGFSIYYFNFFKTIKEKYPETIFHGVNTGDHIRWNVNIDYYLQSLIKEGFLDENMFQHTKDQILNTEKQVEVISSSIAKSDAIRDAGMAQSIMEEWLRIGKKNVMCILGNGHTGKNIHIDEEHKDWYNAGTIIARNFGTSLYHDSDHCLHFETNEREVPPDELFQYNYPDYNEIYVGTSENLPYGINDYSMYDYVKFYLLEDAYEDMKNTPYDGLTMYSYNILPFKPEFNRIYKAVYYTNDNIPGLTEYYRSSPYYVNRMSDGRFLLGLSF